MKSPFKKIGAPTWIIDNEIPIFSQAPNYVTDLLVVEDESVDNE